MSDKKTRILITIIGSILIFSIFVPQFMKSNRSKRTQDFKIINSQTETTSVSTTVNALSSTSAAASRKDKTTKRSTSPVKTTTTTTAIETATVPLFLDINTATSEELQRLYGIGPVLAQAIIDFRIQNDGFNNIDELLLVSGIGESIFSDIKDFVYVVDPVWPEEEADPATEYDQGSEIVTEEEVTEEMSETEEPSTESVYPVNINTADRDELMLLPGVTEARADDIIYVRDKIGSFANENELILVKSLDRSQIVAWRDLICFQ